MLVVNETKSSHMTVHIICYTNYFFLYDITEETLDILHQVYLDT